MNSLLLTQNLNAVNQEISVKKLESGQVLFFPDHFYGSTDLSLLSVSILHKTHKNLSYDYAKKTLGAYNQTIPGLENKLIEIMSGYAEFAFQLIQKVLPDYLPHLQWGRTSYRPAQIQGRASSKRKDDTRLHVDSFSATPVNGLRILRVFCNINPNNEPRVWNLGEPFAQVLKQFAPEICPYSKWAAVFLKMVKTTKSLRSPYDHYMLHLHDNMKKNDQYQAKVKKTTIDFPSKSSWIVFTDHVSHAVLSGQYLLEQTFYLPVDVMNNPELSPLYEWKKYKSDL